MLKVSEAHARAFYNIYIGSVRPVLLERGKKGVMGGFTDNYIRVEWDSKLQDGGDMVKDMDNRIVQVRLMGWNEKGDALIGKMINVD